MANFMAKIPKFKQKPMKKLLLSVLGLSLAAAATAADFSEFFSTTFNGQEIQEGETVVFSQYEDFSDMGYWYTLDVVKVANKGEEPRAIAAVMLYDTPSYAEFSENIDFYGSPSFCFEGAAAVDGSGSNSCLGATPGLNAGNGRFWAPEAGTDTLELHIKCTEAKPEAESKYRIMLSAMEGFDNNDLEECSDPFTFYVLFSANPSAGVAGIAVDNVPAAYYDLQGRRIAEPTKGLFIKVENGKASKILK